MIENYEVKNRNFCIINIRDEIKKVWTEDTKLEDLRLVMTIDELHMLTRLQQDIGQKINTTSFDKVLIEVNNSISRWHIVINNKKRSEGKA